MFTKSPIVVTGASGWFGRVALYEYEQLYGPKALRSNIIPCASKSCLIDISSPFGPIQAVGLDFLDEIDHASGLIHLAFLTREKVSLLGLDQYISTNRAITARVSSFIARNPGIPIITTSSGAASAFDRNQIDLLVNPYAALKYDEEQLWRRSGVGRLSIVFRVYAATGRFIKDPKLFALGDFLASALKGHQIEIRSSQSVIRSYVHVGTMMKLFWMILASSTGCGFQQVDAAMQTMTILELASLVSEIWGLPEPKSSIDPSLPPDDYQADLSHFRELLNEYNIKAPSFTEQLLETALCLGVCRT